MPHSFMGAHQRTTSTTAGSAQVIPTSSNGFAIPGSGLLVHMNSVGCMGGLARSPWPRITTRLRWDVAPERAATCLTVGSALGLQETLPGKTIQIEQVKVFGTLPTSLLFGGASEPWEPTVEGVGPKREVSLRVKGCFGAFVSRRPLSQKELLFEPGQEGQVRRLSATPRGSR